METGPDIPRTALVTGGARRLGAAIARDLARRGWSVAVHHRTSSAAAADLVREIAAAGGRAAALDADLADEAATADLVARTTAALGPPGLLVNNAATFARDSVADATRASWDAHMEPNLRAPFVLTQAFARALCDDGGAGRRGVVVNMIDQRVLRPAAGWTSYSLSKSALWSLTRTLALELAPRVRVAGIAPGPTLPAAGQSDAEFAALVGTLPLGAGATADEICAAVRFIVGTPSFTGQLIALDGGQHLGPAHPGSAGAAPEAAAAPPGRRK